MLPSSPPPSEASSNRMPAVGRDVAESGEVQPGEIALDRIAGRLADDSEAQVLVEDQHFLSGRDVGERERSRLTVDEAQSPRGRYRMEGAIAADLRSREPDLLSVRPPGQALEARPALGEVLRVSRQIHDHHGPEVAVAPPVVEERDRVPGRRKARIADPAGRLVQHFPDGRLQTVPASGIPHDGEPLAVGGPIRPLHSLHPLPRRLAALRPERPRECRWKRRPRPSALRAAGPAPRKG